MSLVSLTKLSTIKIICQFLGKITKFQKSEVSSDDFKKDDVSYF